MKGKKLVNIQHTTEIASPDIGLDEFIIRFETVYGENALYKQYALFKKAYYKYYGRRFNRVDLTILEIGRS